MGDCRHSIGEAARQVRVFTPVAVYEGSVLPLAFGLVTNNVGLTERASLRSQFPDARPCVRFSWQ